MTSEFEKVELPKQKVIVLNAPLEVNPPVSHVYSNHKPELLTNGIGTDAHSDEAPKDLSHPGIKYINLIKK